MKSKFDWKTKILFFLISFLIPFSCLAGGIKVRPAVISQQALPRDFLEFQVNIENQASYPVRLYAVVNDISMQEGKQEFLDPTELSRPTSLARWVEITRGQTKLEPGENKDISLSINVPPDAEPGKRYVLISFSQGSNREEAEERARELNQPQVLLDIEVKDNTIEKAQINKFSTEKGFFFGFPIKLSLEVENIGNQQVRPRGQIHIYNRQGEEVETLTVNDKLAAVSPSANQIFEALWEAEKGFGRYKARLVAEYGEDNRKLQDTIYFWVLPWKFLAMMGGGFLVTVIILGTFILRSGQGRGSEKSNPVSTIDISSSIKRK
ncbi:MAG: hypothetical protein GF370_04810 [Candidatus Nealsonbacteria bacterium]|nr:hypothetical protein [Candidatus Nealsonbacteria bacterium]